MTFRWKNYARAGDPATMSLKAEELIRRFLLHVLPKGFVKLRHFGFLANRYRREDVVLCHKLSVASSTAPPDLAPSPCHSDEAETDTADRCPRCNIGSREYSKFSRPKPT